MRRVAHSRSTLSDLKSIAWLKVETGWRERIETRSSTRPAETCNFTFLQSIELSVGIVFGGQVTALTFLEDLLQLERI